MNARKKPIIVYDRPGYSGPFTGSDAGGQSISEQNLRILSRLQNVAGTVSKDMGIPKSAHLKHVKINWKKKQLQEEKCSEIERENRILLEKMKKIYTKQANQPGNNGLQGSSMMETTERLSQVGLSQISCDRLETLGNRRRMEQEKLVADNKKMLKRLQAKKSNYNFDKWEKDEASRQELLRRVSQLPKNQGGREAGKYSEGQRHHERLYRERQLLEQPLLAPVLLKDHVSLVASQRALAQMEQDLKLRKQVRFDAQQGSSVDQLAKGGPFGHMRPHDLEPGRIVVHKRGLELDGINYICEISYNKRGFFISLFSVEDPGRCGTLHLKNSERTDQILRSLDNDFDKMAKAIRLRDGKIHIRTNAAKVRAAGGDYRSAVMKKVSMIKNLHEDLGPHSAGVSLSPDRTDPSREVHYRQLSSRDEQHHTMNASLKRNLDLFQSIERQDGSLPTPPMHAAANRPIVKKFPVHEAANDRSRSQALQRALQKGAAQPRGHLASHSAIAKPAEAGALQHQQYMSQQNSDQASPVFLSRQATPMLGLAIPAKARKGHKYILGETISTGHPKEPNFSEGNYKPGRPGHSDTIGALTADERRARYYRMNTGQEGLAAQSCKQARAYDRGEHIVESSDEFVRVEKGSADSRQGNLGWLQRAKGGGLGQQKVGGQADEQMDYGPARGQNRSCLDVMGTYGQNHRHLPNPQGYEDFHKIGHQSLKPKRHNYTNNNHVSQAEKLSSVKSQYLSSIISKQDIRGPKTGSPNGTVKLPLDSLKKSGFRPLVRSQVAKRREGTGDDPCPSKPHFTEGSSCNSRAFPSAMSTHEVRDRALNNGISIENQEHAYGGVDVGEFGQESGKNEAASLYNRQLQHQRGLSSLDGFGSPGYHSHSLDQVHPGQQAMIRTEPASRLSADSGVYLAGNLGGGPYQGASLEQINSTMASLNIQREDSGGVKIQDLIARQQEMLRVRQRAQGAAGTGQRAAQLLDPIHGDIHRSGDAWYEFPKKKISKKNENVFQRLSKPKKRASINQNEQNVGQRHAGNAKLSNKDGLKKRSSVQHSKKPSNAPAGSQRVQNTNNSKMLVKFDGTVDHVNKEGSSTGSPLGHHPVQTQGGDPIRENRPPSPQEDQETNEADGSVTKQSADKPINYARLAGSSERLFLRESQRALAAKEKMKTSHMKKRSGTRFHNDPNVNCPVGHVDIRRRGAETPALIESPGAMRDNHAEMIDQKQQKRGSISNNAKHITIIKAPKTANDNTRAGASNARSRGYPQGELDGDDDFKCYNYYEHSQDSHYDDRENGQVVVLDDEQNRSQYDSQVIEPTSNMSYYGGTQEGFGKGTQGANHNNGALTRSNFNDGARSTSQKSVKILQNVKQTIQPPSMLDEIKREVSEYSQSQKHFLRTQSRKQQQQNRDQITKAKMKTNTPQIQGGARNKRGQISPKLGSGEAASGGEPRFNMNRTGGFSGGPGTQAEQKEGEQIGTDEENGGPYQQPAGGRPNETVEAGNDSEYSEFDDKNSAHSGVAAHNAQRASVGLNQSNGKDSSGNVSESRQQREKAAARPPPTGAANAASSTKPNRTASPELEAGADERPEPQLDGASRGLQGGSPSSGTAPGSHQIPKVPERLSKRAQMELLQKSKEADALYESHNEDNAEPALPDRGRRGGRADAAVVAAPSTRSPPERWPSPQATAANQPPRQIERGRHLQNNHALTVRQESNASADDGTDPSRQASTRVQNSTGGEEAKEEATRQSQLSSIRQIQAPDSLMATIGRGRQVSNDVELGGDPSSARQMEPAIHFGGQVKEGDAHENEADTSIPAHFARTGSPEQQSRGQNPVQSPRDEPNQPFLPLRPSPQGSPHEMCADPMISGPARAELASLGRINSSKKGREFPSQKEQPNQGYSGSWVASAFAKANSSLDMSEFSFQDKSKGYPVIQLRFRGSASAEADGDQHASAGQQAQSNSSSSRAPNEHGTAPMHASATADRPRLQGTPPSSKYMNMHLVGLDARFQSRSSDTRNHISAIMERTLEQSAEQTDPSTDGNPPALQGGNQADDSARQHQDPGADPNMGSSNPYGVSQPRARAQARSVVHGERTAAAMVKGLTRAGEEPPGPGQGARVETNRGIPPRACGRPQASLGPEPHPAAGVADFGQPGQAYADIVHSSSPVASHPKEMLSRLDNSIRRQKQEKARKAQRQLIEHEFELYIKDDLDLADDEDYRAIQESIKRNSRTSPGKQERQADNGENDEANESDVSGVDSARLNDQTIHNNKAMQAARYGQQDVRANDDGAEGLRRGRRASPFESADSPDRQASSQVETADKRQINDPSTEEYKEASRPAEHSSSPSNRMISLKTTNLTPKLSRNVSSSFHQQQSNPSEVIPSPRSPNILAQIRHMDDVTSFNDSQPVHSIRTPVVGGNSGDERSPPLSEATETRTMEAAKSTAGDVRSQDKQESSDYSSEFEEDANSKHSKNNTQQEKQKIGQNKRRQSQSNDTTNDAKQQMDSLYGDTSSREEDRTSRRKGPSQRSGRRQANADEESSRSLERASSRNQFTANDLHQAEDCSRA